MGDWLLYAVPWWVWLIAVAVAVGLVHRLIGFRNALVAAAVAVAAILQVRARQQGRQDKERELDAERLRSMRDRRESDAKVDRLDDNGRNSEWSKWLRDKR